MRKDLALSLLVVAALVAIIVGWHFYGVSQIKQPIKTDGATLTTLDFDSFQNALADHVRSKFNVPQGSVVVADVPYDVGTLLDSVQDYPSDDSDCLPKPLPPVRDAINLFPSYQLSSQTAVQATLGSNALQNLTSAGLSLTHSNTLVYSIDQVSVQFMDLKTLGQLASQGACGTYVAQHPGVRLIRGVVMGRISFKIQTDNPGEVQARLKGVGGGSISTDPGASTVTVSDEKTTQILQMLAVIEAQTPPSAALAPRPPDGGAAAAVALGTVIGALRRPAPPQPVAAPPAGQPAGQAAGPPAASARPLVREARTSQTTVPPPGNFVARIYLQQDAANPPDAGTRLAIALQQNWPKALVIQKVESIASAKMPSGAQVRFFNANDSGVAMQCKDRLKQIGIDARVVRVGLGAPQGQLEVWLPRASG